MIRAAALAATLLLSGVADAHMPGDAGVTVDVTADRVGNAHPVGPAVPNPDPVTYVNSLPYRFYDPEPAETAWYVVTMVEFGWDQARQDAWWPFAKDVMLGESGFCWNRLRGDEMQPTIGVDCVAGQIRQGRHEDAGFGQVTWVLYGPHSTMCQQRGICSRWTVIQDPWTSMVAMVHAMNEQGSQPWCYDRRALAHHDCWLAPDR